MLSCLLFSFVQSNGLLVCVFVLFGFVLLFVNSFVVCFGVAFTCFVRDVVI